MGKDAVLDAIRRFQRAVESQGIRVDRMILFGSYAKGNAREDSDIDVMVISEDFKPLGYWERLEVLSRAVAVVWEPIEAVAKTPEEWENRDSLITEFAREGETLYIP